MRIAGGGRGGLIDALTQWWVRLTGRRVDLRTSEWLEGPSGEADRVGDTWLQREADRHGGTLQRDLTDAGLLPSMALLDGPDFDANELRPEVRSFYEHTSAYRLELWSQWSPVAWPFGWLISTLFARRLEQLSLPLRPLDVALGMTSEVQPVLDAAGAVIGTSWQRRLRSTGAPVYSGWYGTTTLPGSTRASVRVVFPLPNGRLVVLLHPEVGPDGSLLLTSHGGKWAQDGTYLVVHHHGSIAWARRIPIHEQFRVYVDPEGILRTDHTLALWSVTALRLHYRLDQALQK